MRLSCQGGFFGNSAEWHSAAALAPEGYNQAITKEEHAMAMDREALRYWHRHFGLLEGCPWVSGLAGPLDGEM